MDGKAVIPEFLIAITQGEELAFPVSEVRLGSLEGTIIPMRSVPKT
jgi:hypothetical protein